MIQVGSVHAEVIQIGHHAYITGNGTAMVSYFGFPKADRSRLAGRWVALTPADPGYQSAVDDVSIGSAVNDLVPTGTLTRTTTTFQGRPVVAITGRPPASDHAPATAKITLFLSEGRQPLPVRQTETAPGGISDTTTLTHWGEPLTLTAPRHPIAIPAATSTA